MDVVGQPRHGQPEIEIGEPTEGILLLRLKGEWKMAAGLPSANPVRQRIEAAQAFQQLTFDTRDMTGWDSGLLTFLVKVFHCCGQKQISVSKEGLPEGVAKLLDLAFAIPEQKDVIKPGGGEPLLARIGASALDVGRGTTEMLAFIGEAFLACIKLARGKARFRRVDLTVLIQDCGARALPIVSLISVLVGLILAFVGAVQLRLFGAQIYVADLVGLGMAREMGAMMTAVIMAGRTGAAFAAQLGTMQVNEEIDAFRTMGVSPMEFLVLPRMIALVLMLPLLCLYADFMGILGGAIVGVGMLDLSAAEYFQETREAVRLMDFAVGVIKSGVFGVLVALAGCLRGIKCGRSASAVGDAATSAVVTAIVFIIVSDAILTVIYDILGV